MATSGSTDWVLTRNTLITEALEMVGAIPLGRTPTNTHLQSANRSLNALAKGLQRDHVHLHTVDEENVNTVAGQNYIQLASGTRKVLEAFVLMGGIRYPLTLRTREEFNSFEQPGLVGRPQNAFVDFGTSPPTMFFYFTPDAIYDLHYVRERLIEDFDDPDDNPDFLVDASDVLIFGLAHRLSYKFRLPLPERDRLKMEFERARIAYIAGDNQRTGVKRGRPNTDLIV